MDSYNKGAIFAILEKLIKMTTQLLIVTFLARFLGPSEFGQFMYCYAIVTILSFLNNLGLETILIRYFIDFKSEQFSFLTHGLLLRLVFGFICVLIANLAGLFLVEDDYRWLLFIISLLHIFTPFSIFAAILQTRERSDLAAVGLIVGNLAGGLYVLLCLVIELGLNYIAVFYLIDAIFVAITYIVLTKSNNISCVLPIKFERLTYIFKGCLPLLLSGAVTLLYMKVDQIMLGMMSDVKEVGNYVAATRLSEAWYFVGLTLIGVYYPKILHIRDKYGDKAYLDNIARYGNRLLWLSIILAAVTTALSSYIITFLYGQEYIDASKILSITIWAVPFVYLGSISTKMYVAASKEKVLIKRSLLGLLSNFVLNVLLIPSYGAVGAAVATLFAQIAVGVLFNFSKVAPEVLTVQLGMLTNPQNVKK